MKYLLYVLVAVICGSTACMAQSTNSESANSSWGKPVQDVRMSVSIDHNVIPAGSQFVVTIEVTNASTNILLVGETAPEGIFTVNVADEFGRTWQLTRSSHFYTRALISNLKPGQSRTWRILAAANKYFEPPGLVPTPGEIPPGDYVLKTTGNFQFKDGVRDIGLEADLKIQIK